MLLCSLLVIPYCCISAALNGAPNTNGEGAACEEGAATCCAAAAAYTALTGRVTLGHAIDTVAAIDTYASAIRFSGKVFAN